MFDLFIEWSLGILLLVTSYKFMENKVYKKENKILDCFRYSSYFPSTELQLVSFIGAISWLIFTLTWLFIYIKFIR